MSKLSQKLIHCMSLFPHEKEAILVKANNKHGLLAGYAACQPFW